MADASNQDWAVQLPNQAPAFGQVLQSMIGQQERQQERADSLAERQRQFNERQQDRNLANQYKNAELIREGTDISKYETGDAAANRIASTVIKSQLPNLYELAKSNPNPIDLQMQIQNIASKVVPALSNIKREYTLGDEAVKKIGQLSNNINTESLLEEYRKDVHNRTVDANGNLIPVHLVKPSTFQQNLDNPDFLSSFVNGNSNLTESIINPKGMDKKAVPIGSQDAHDVYYAEVPHWKEPNYNQEQLQKGGGFLPRGFVPELKIKGESISMDKAPDLVGNGKTIMVADEGDYKRFAENPKTNLELISETKSLYPNKYDANGKIVGGYDSFSNVEKEFAKRQALYQKIESLDRTSFVYKNSVRPTKTNINLGERSNQKINDAVESNTGVLKEHFEGAIQDNPRVVYNSDKKSNETWGELGQNEITRPFKARVEEVVKDASGNEKVVAKTVPFDKYFVTPENKIYGAYYARKGGQMTNQILKQEEIPLRQYTERLVSKTTSPSTRKAVVDENIKEVKGEVKPSQTQPKTVTFKANGKIYNIPQNEVSSFLKDMPNAQKQ